MKISIFLPLFNRRDELKRSLRALIPEKGEHEVFVVDMGSTDGSQDVAKEHDWVQIISSKEGLRSKALNAAVEESTGEILFFMDPGSLPARGWAQALQAHFEAGADAGHLNCSEVDATAKWAASLRSLSMKVGHQVLGGPASLNGVAVSKAAFEKVSGFRPVPDFEWLAFAARLKESGAKVKAIKHEILVAPAAGSRQANAWQELKEDLVSAWKFRKSDSFDATRNKRKASCAVIFGYDAFEKPAGHDFFKKAQEEIQNLTIELMQSYRGVEKIYFIGGSASNKLVGQPSGVEVIGKPRTALDKRFSELLERIRSENQEGLLLVKSNSMELGHDKLRMLSEGESEEPCVILPEANSDNWTALWLEQPVLEAISDWELAPDTPSLKAHLKSKIFRCEEEAPVKSLRTDSDARSLYYAGVLDQHPA
ncbi:glycosyltransferase [Kiritimatiellaeota bacterium B1221]|nr:glycosyltransferase [Kiritimatiellaeota bacterium B1221]